VRLSYGPGSRNLREMHQYSAIRTPIARTTRKKMARNTKLGGPWDVRDAFLMFVWHGEVEVFVV
jgi:hypothetical protein